MSILGIACSWIKLFGLAENAQPVNLHVYTPCAKNLIKKHNLLERLSFLLMLTNVKKIHDDLWYVFTDFPDQSSSLGKPGPLRTSADSVRK